MLLNRGELDQKLGRLNFTARTVNNLKKHEFLASKTNKQRFINLLSESLVKAGYKIVNANGDADLIS